MILADLPYGTTACSWDVVIPFEPLWIHYKRVIKKNGAIVLFGTEPFSSMLRSSNISMYKYDWIWEKNRATGHVHSKNKPMRLHENISVFSFGVTLHEGQSNNRMVYFPQGLEKMPDGTPRRTRNDAGDDSVMSRRKSHKSTVYEFTNYPVSILRYAVDVNNGNRFHPTQKPVALLEYLIRTYTQEGETVLDNTMGSGSTGVACINTNRDFVGIELDEKYYRIAENRIWKAVEDGNEKP